MDDGARKKWLPALLVIPAVWLGIRYVLPVSTPFVLGAVLAFAAEPLVSFSQKHLKLRRGIAAGVGVTATLLLLSGVVYAAGALLLRQLGRLARDLPDLERTTEHGIVVLQDWLINLSAHAPESVQPMLVRTVNETLGSGSDIMHQLTNRIPGMLTAAISAVPDGALSLGTGLLSAFMISGRLPKLRTSLTGKFPGWFRERSLPAMERTRRALGGWLKAQGLLALVTYGIVAVGFLLLKIPHGLFWAIAVALLDAVPMLGTGLVLAPWAVVSFLQGNPAQAIGLLVIVIAATACRSALEPRLVGRHLGLDPLVTLLALYAGYKVWGFWGLILAPILTAAASAMLGFGKDSVS